MARKKRGLGRSLTDILAEENRISASRELSQLIPQEDPETHGGGDLPEFGMYGPRADSLRTPAPTENPETGVDYSTYYVGDARPPSDNYGQGPDRSTRVAAHKFVPYSRERVRPQTGAGMGRAGDILGTVYVKFHKPGRNGQVYRYNRVPEAVYEQFSNSTSKGRFINNFLNNYSYKPVGSRDDIFHTNDFGENEYR